MREFWKGFSDFYGDRRMFGEFFGFMTLLGVMVFIVFAVIGGLIMVFQ